MVRQWGGAEPHAARRVLSVRGEAHRSAWSEHHASCCVISVARRASLASSEDHASIQHVLRHRSPSPLRVARRIVSDRVRTTLSIPHVLVIPMRALLTLAALSLLACSSQETPEQQIRKVLDEGAAALEARDADRVAATLSDNYKDGNGRDKQRLKGLAFFALQQGPVLVSMQTVTIALDGKDKANVSMKALALQGSDTLKTAKDLLPTNARSFDLKLAMAKESGDWRVAAIEGINVGGGFE